MMKKINKKLVYAVSCGAAAMGISAGAYAAEESEDSLQNFVLDPIVITASRIPLTITESKADVSVVSRKQIEEMHMENVEEALRTVPGVQFLNYGGNGLNANLSGIRINGSKDVVVLIDGVRVSDFQGSGGSGYMYASQLNNMDNIERVEVLRGSAATVYGSGAKGGVINIITRDIQKNKSTIDIANGSFGKENYKFNTQGKRGDLGWNIYYGKSLSGDFEDGAGKEWEGSNNSKNVGVKFVYDFDESQKLTVSYDKIKAEYSGADMIYKKNYEGNYETKNFTLKHDYKISNQWGNSFTYRKNDVVSNYYQTMTEPYNSDYSYEFISDQVNYTTPRNSLIFGLDYSKGDNNLLTRIGSDPNTGNRLMGYVTMKNYSYYIQDDWEFIPRVTLSGGIRYDKPSTNLALDLGSHTSKSYKLSWDITDNDTLYAGRSDFYILPGIEQLTITKYGNDKLKPAEGRTSSIGYNKKFDDYNIFTVNWFETKSDVTIGYGSSGQFQNFSNAVSKGWNAQYMTQLGEHWNANIGWSHLSYHANGDNYEMGYYPKDMATFGIYYNYAKVSAGVDGYYFMRKKNSAYSQMQGWPADNYGVYNLSVNYAPTKNLNFYCKVDNIFDKLYAEHTNVIHQGGQPGTWYSMPGRSFIVGMQLKF